MARQRHIIFALLVAFGVFLLLSSLSSLPPSFSATIFDDIEDESPDSNVFSMLQVSNIPHLQNTRIPLGAHSHGYTIFEELYMRNGTLYVVTPIRSSFPSMDALLAAPLDRGKGHDLTADESHLRFVDPHTAHEILGDDFIRLDDLTVIIYDSKQFMTHYYHWWGEIMLGFWRVYSMLGIGLDGTVAPLPFPKRFLLPFVEDGGWRDPAGVDGPLMRAVYPTVSIETSSYWKDLITLDKTVVFTRAALINREAAHRHPFSNLWFKMMASTMSLPVPDGFWNPVRKAVVKNLLQKASSEDSSQGSSRRAKPLVTYVSRQRTGRRLTDEAHEELVRALKDLESEGLCQVIIPVMERTSLKDQIELASKTTIMVGVHGNGLTHQLWMPPSTRSTIIEIFFPGGYIYDYEILARNVGHRHFAIWNDTYLTYPKGETHQGITMPDGFQGSQIPVHAPTVAEIIRERLMDMSEGS